MHDLYMADGEPGHHVQWERVKYGQTLGGGKGLKTGNKTNECAEIRPK